MSRVENFLLGGRHNRSTIHVGLVNNMPDADMRATELQFAKLLKESAGALDVRLRLFSLRGIARGEQARSRMDGFYDDAAFLHAANIDALIITGAPDTGSGTKAQAWWPELTQLIDWAETGTLSTLFSGQAAEAGVLHLDGIKARPLGRKLSGVFPAMRVEDDPLFFSQTLTVPVPHGRSHEIAESDLSLHGYRVLSRLASGQVDIFTREPAGQSRFVFLQGHPEYDRTTLAREYLRDLERFHAGNLAAAPAMPENYFDRATENRLGEAGADLARISEIVTGALTLQSWRLHTGRLFSNWLTLVAAAKARRTSSRNVHTRKRAS
ncbi:MAG: homoserine O-succinyltransferase [Pseudomonadota bacterium]